MRLDWNLVWQSGQHFNLWYLLPAIGLSLVGFVVSTNKWGIFLTCANLSTSFYQRLRLFWIGTFFNNFLPGRTGGDVVRAYGITRHAKDKITATLTVVMDRGLNLVALVSIAVFVLILAPQALPESIRYNLLIGSAALCGIGLLGIGVGWLASKKITRFGSLIIFGKTLLQKPIHMTVAMGLALIYQTTMILSNYAIALGLGLKLSPAIFFIFIPLTALATMLPISLNGWGLREGAYALSFGAFGVAPELAITLSVISTLCMIGLSAIGGLFYISQNVDISFSSKESMP